MSADRRPPRPGDTVVIYGPLAVVEEIDNDGFATVTAEGYAAQVPTAWLVVVHDRRGGDV